MFKFNPTTAELELASGSVTTVSSPVVDQSIVRYSGTTGNFIEDSLSYVQDGGGIEAQGFITRRSVTANVVVTSGSAWIAPSLELELTGSIEIENESEIIIV